MQMFYFASPSITLSLCASICLYADCFNYRLARYRQTEKQNQIGCLKHNHSDVTKPQNMSESLQLHMISLNHRLTTCGLDYMDGSELELRIRIASPSFQQRCQHKINCLFIVTNSIHNVSTTLILCIYVLAGNGIDLQKLTFFLSLCKNRQCFICTTIKPYCVKTRPFS